MPYWIFLLGAAGFVYVLTQGVITARIRRIYPPLLECPMCSGVWFGWIAVAYLVLREKGMMPAWLTACVEIFVGGFVVSLLASAAVIALCTVGSHKMRGRMVVKQLPTNKKKG